MRTLFAIAFGLLLMCAGQLCAQQDPFGPFVPDAAAPADRRPTLTPEAAPSETEKQASQPAPTYPSIRVGRGAGAEERIENALNRETKFDYLDQPLKDVFEDISFHNNIPIVFDTRALEDHGIDIATPITRAFAGISLRSALKLTLRELDLTFIIRDEVLQITHREFAATVPSTRFYSVAGLLPPGGDGQTLEELIKRVVAPDSWSGAGSTGAIIYVDHLESLVIRQTDEVFTEIDQFLAATKQIIEKRRSEERPRGTASVRLSGSSHQITTK